MATLPPIQSLRRAYADGEATPTTIAEQALARSNSNAGRNVYLALDPAWTLAEAAKLAPNPVADQPLYGVPVSLKDCFDLAGFPTTCGSRFYADRNGVAQQDSAVAATLRASGAIITGKTNLHQLAYGITGENPDYGDCLQPRDARLLTGGSSSGAAASVQEGSALAAIGTDTGGSIRAPAALCGLAGYRSSYGLADSLGLWEGAMHLSTTFDTLGWIFGDLRDGPLLAQALFGLAPAPAPDRPRVGCVAAAFLHDCDPSVLKAFEQSKNYLRQNGAVLTDFAPDFWDDCMEFFAPIQSSEAAAIHRGNFQHFEKSIAERLTWGASFSHSEIQAFRERHARFLLRMGALVDGPGGHPQFDFLLMPATPIRDLRANADHSSTRKTILRYTSPFSLAGVPAVTLTGLGGGMQLAAARGDDARLLAFAASLTK